MTLTTGSRFGAYDVQALIGVGGMGEVYRARDTRLGREVALKLVSGVFAGNPEGLARFEREAKLLASLSHPHIAAIYELGEHEGVRYLAMELIEGETLADKLLKDGALTVGDALRLALEIAQGLEAAHDKGVIHRDLKPANVMVTRDGRAKILDFGLAKAFATEASGAPAQSPTLSAAMTQQGFLLGTAGYMSPEQAAGQSADQRADVWSFGVVLYEMLTGAAPFPGESAPHILAAVLRAEPEWSRLPKDLHPRIAELLARCLEKKARNRYHGIADARVDIEKVLADPQGVTPPRVGPRVAVAQSPLRRLAATVALVVVGAAVAGAAAWSLKPEPERLVRRFSDVTPLEHGSQNSNRRTMAVSADGRRIAYLGRPSGEDALYVRDVDELEARTITTGANIVDPFFSPDSEWIGFFAGPELMRVSVRGGTPLLIANVSSVEWGASWAADGMIYFGQDNGIFRVPASGGVPELVLARERDEVLANPVLLPDGETLLFTARPVIATYDQADIVASPLSTRERRVLIRGGADARYVASGHLVYAVDDSVFAVPFDAGAVAVLGGAVPVVQGVARAEVTGAANFGVAADGTLVYLRGAGSTALRTLVWIDREGREEPIGVPARNYNYAQLSPDGTRVALDVRDEQSDIWVFDLARAALQRLSFDPGLNRTPIWSPDGARVAFSQVLDNNPEVHWQAADGSGAAEPLTRGSSEDVFPTGFTPDGKTLLYSDGPPPRDLWAVAVDGSGQGAPLIAGEGNQMSGTVAPNGRWVAYQSDESGRNEIYVRPYPDVNAGRWQISTEGGTHPLWSRDGQELFYLASSPPAVMAVSIDADTRWGQVVPRRLFEGNFVVPQVMRPVYDVSLDGQRFLMIQDVRQGGRATFVFVDNWVAELERLVPTP